MNRTDINTRVYDLVGEYFDASADDTAQVIEETLFQMRHALMRGTEIDLDYLGVLRKNSDGTYTYDPREVACDADEAEDDEEKAHANAG